MSRVFVTGTLVTGIGNASGFTSLDWARAAFREAVGIDPHPGTINLTVAGTSLLRWRQVRATSGIVIYPPRTDWCDARLWRATIAGRIPAGIVLPDVPGYAETQIELIAPVRVRDALGVTDGAEIGIEVET
jgi:riboflavin kinase